METNIPTLYILEVDSSVIMPFWPFVQKILRVIDRIAMVNMTRAK